MEYDNSFESECMDQDNSNYSCAADLSHLLEFTAEEGGDSDDDNSNIVINDDTEDNSDYDAYTDGEWRGRRGRQGR